MANMASRTTHVTTGLQQWDEGAQYVAYDNLTEASAAVLSASSEDGDFTAALAGNWFAGDQKWKAATVNDPEWVRVDLGSTQDVDTFGVYGHNLGTIGATLEFQYADASGGPWTTLGSAIAPTDDNAIMRVADASKAKRYWRLKISGASAAPVIAIWFVGQALKLHIGPNDGFAPPNFNRDNEILNSESGGGEFLGRSVIRRGNTGVVSVRFAPPNWMRTKYEPFLEAAELHPFFWSWNHTTYPDEIVLAYSDGDIGGPTYTDGGAFMQHSFKVRAR